MTNEQKDFEKFTDFFSNMKFGEHREYNHIIRFDPQENNDPRKIENYIKENKQWK